MGEVGQATAHGWFAEQCSALLEGGADAILVETMSDPAEMEVAVRAAQTCGAQAILATYAFQRAGGEFRTMMGTPVAEAVSRALEAGAHVVGANCGTQLTLADYIELGSQLVHAAGAAPVLLQPNAGSPTLVEGRAVYHESPDGMAAAALAIQRAGVRILGGCCGTTPEHLAALARMLRCN